MTLRLLLADDHDVVIAGLRQVLHQPDFEIVGEVMDGRALVEAVERLRPDIAITDIAMPYLNGLDAVRQFRAIAPEVKVVFLTMHSDLGYATDALALGECGYVLKSSVAEELPSAIRAVAEGRTYIARALACDVARAIEVQSHDPRHGLERLTTRQREVLQLLADGGTTKEIAHTLRVSPKTVEFHKYRIMQELGVRTTAGLVRSAMTLGLCK